MRKLIFDMSGVIWYSLLAGRDSENGRDLPHPSKEGKTVHVASAEFGFENAINSLVSLMKRFDAAPKDVIAVFEGRDAKHFRQYKYPAYKEGRGDDRVPEMYEEFNKLAQMLRQVLLSLGATCVSQAAVEADDVIAYLTKNLQMPTVVITRDGDLQVLRSEKTDVLVGDRFNENKYGPFPLRHTTLYKALVGDVSDNIKGAPGFGPKAFLDLYCMFGDEGLDALQELILNRRLDDLVEDVAELKALQKVIDGAESVYTSFEVASLYPNRVNTRRLPLKIEAGLVAQWDPHQHDSRFKAFYGQRRIVHRDNFTEAVAWAMPRIAASDWVSLDIETSTPQESDDWLELRKKATDDDGDVGVDVFGSKLTSLALTFGANQQYTLYFTVDHKEEPDCRNVTSEQVREFVRRIPADVPIVIQNVAFELTVLFQEWGFWLPGIEDTKLMASYVNENQRAGLKQRSKAVLGYEQVDYKTVTQGRKMNELTATEAFAYGTDDTICTSALYNYYRLVMELEGSYSIYREVEIDAAYLDAERFVQGTPISVEKMRELEKLDQDAYDAAWALISDRLTTMGWEGTRCPQFGPDLTPADVKLAYAIITGEELQTQVRKLDKLAALIDAAGHDHLAGILRSADVQALNELVKLHFNGAPKINFDSPPQMRRLLYDSLGLPVRLYNKPTAEMIAAGKAAGTPFRDIKGSPRTDDLAVRYALMFDQDKGEDVVQFLKALQALKISATRAKMFYKPYSYVRHWKDNKVHAHINQCQAATRRDTSSGPNLQQLPKHPKATGEPARFREIFVSHLEAA